MSADLERRLREALHDDARRARLVNPVRPPTMPRPLVVPQVQQRPAASHRRLALVAAAVILLITSGLVLVQAARDGATDGPSSPASTRPGATSAPTSTTPSTPPPTRGTEATVEPSVAPGRTAVFTDLAPGSTVELPAAPIDIDSVTAATWTGTEIVLWGGIGDDGTTVADGAAFDLASGTWRRLATAPIQRRSFAKVVWTGTEMIVWGGVYRDGTLTEGGNAYQQTPLGDGAAYDPATDTWRRLPDAPIDVAVGTNAVWTGAELIVLGGGQGEQLAAYDPAADEWRRLADAPGSTTVIDAGPSIWTGRSVLTLVGTSDLARVLVRYDRSSDTWSVDTATFYAALVGVPDVDGRATTVLALPSSNGAPVDVLDDAGRVVGQLPGLALDVDRFGERVSATATWVGEDALFRIFGDWGYVGDSAYLDVGGESVRVDGDPVTWALNPATQTWRELAVDISPSGLTMGDVMLGWVDSPGDAPDRPVLYRAPTTVDPSGGP